MTTSRTDNWYIEPSPATDLTPVTNLLGTAADSGTTVMGKINDVQDDSSDILDKLGTKGDFVHIPFVGSNTDVLQYLTTGYYHIHGESFVYPKYAEPVELTASSGAWTTTGTIVEIIPALFTDRPFDLHWVSIEDISATLYGIIDIYANDTVIIGSVDVSRTTNFSREAALPLQIPQQPAGTKISGKFSSNISGTGSVKIKLYGHFYG